MTFENQFGRLERLLHRFSFGSRFSQVMLADLEDIFYRRRMDSITLDEPVFVTGLPRSGTTILLELLVDSGHFASHTYRDMPFVLCPLFWSTFSKHFVADDDQSRERAHGDGIRITSRSPEAFEEILWKQFWPEHYLGDRIDPWSPAEADAEFVDFFQRHMAKIILVRRDDSGRSLRYVSKNNVNIARLGAASLPLRDGIVVVPFREPYQHAASMLRQHRRFSELQRRDPFAQRYMEGIGHHDFGLGLKPIDFGGWLEDPGDPDRMDFWMRYWCAAYRHVLSYRSGEVYLLSYDGLTTDPANELRRLSNRIHVPSDDLTRLDGRIRRSRSHDVGSEEIALSTRAVAEEVHRDLLAVAEEQR